MNCVSGDLLPTDTIFSEDLLKLGFVITRDDKIRYIKALDQGPRYKINRSDRMNKVHIEALHAAIHTNIIDRLLGMGMHFMKVPKGSKRQVPILVSGNLSTAPRVVVFFGEIIEDLGMFSYRDACDDGISFGSVLGFAKALLGENALDSPNALILANAGHTVWHNSGWASMTVDSFHNRHRASSVGRERSLAPRNIVGMGSIAEHVQNIFEQVLMRGNFRVGARIDVLGLSEGGTAAMKYLKNQWSFWSPHISSLSLINPEIIISTDTKTDDLKDPRSFAWFMKYRCRSWAICDKPIGTRVPVPSSHGCNTYSSGEGTKSSCMITRGVGHILTWMNVMHYSPLAMERFDVVPGETDPNSEAVHTSLNNDMNPELPGGKIEVHSLDVLNQIQGFLTGVTFTEEMVTFFNDKLCLGSDDGDNNSESSSVCRVENKDDFVPLPNFSDVPNVPTEVPNAPSILPDAPDITGVFPNILPDVPGILPNVLPGVSNVPDVLPDILDVPKALPDTPGVTDVPDVSHDVPVLGGTYYPDVVVGQTGPFDLTDLQDIREENEED
ncbi:unnamed protein product [Penicillium glandicola]